MPLLVEGRRISRLGDLKCEGGGLISSLKNRNSRLKATELRIVGENDFSLYVSQNEFASIKPGVDSIKLIGTDEATTCHILVFRHTGTGAISLGHLDGSSTYENIGGMLRSLMCLSRGGPEGRIEMHLIGGFKDRRNLSGKLVKEIMDEVILLHEEIHLVTFCTSVLDANNETKGGVDFPVLTGIGLFLFFLHYAPHRKAVFVSPATSDPTQAIVRTSIPNILQSSSSTFVLSGQLNICTSFSGVEIDSGNIFRAEFSYKGPDYDIKSAANFVAFKEVVDIYRNGHLEVGPFVWEIVGDDRWPADACDELIRRNYSTSPDQESKYFASHIRAAFKILNEHPDPLQSLFKEGKARIYKMDGHTGCWERVCK